MKWMQNCKPVLCGIVVCMLMACGGEGNLADCDTGPESVPCEELSKEDEARQALDNRDFETAVTLLTELVQEEPENYGRFTLLGAAHAGRAGLDIFAVARANFSGGGSLLDTMTAFLPDPADLGDAAYALSLTDMDLAVQRLVAIPATLRASDSSELYSASAILQLTLYQSAYSVMYVNQFAISAETGSFDPSGLAEMSDEDATVILQSLASAAANQTGEEGQVVSQAINEALAAIDAQEGGTDREKLQEFIELEYGAPAPTQ